METSEITQLCGVVHGNKLCDQFEYSSVIQGYHYKDILCQHTSELKRTRQ